MKIETLSISGLRSHRGNPSTEIDLAGKPLVAVVGPTGAGKSSILEAVCFALYGEATFGGKAYAELATDGRSEMTVLMSFSIGGERYQLVRSVAPGRSGFAAKATWLRKVDEDGKALTHTDQVTKVNAAVRKLLGGMDREQFCQAVLLAQNRYAELLEAEEGKRNELLHILLGLTALEDARKALAVTDKAARRNEERLRDKRAELPSDPVAAAREATARAKAIDELARKAKDGHKKLAELVAEAERLSTEERALQEAAELKVAGADGYERLAGLVATLEGLREDEERIASELEAALSEKEKAEVQLGEARAALVFAEEEHGKAGLHDVVAVRLGELGRLVLDRRGQEGELEAAKASIAEAEEKLTAARASEERARVLLEGQASALREAEERAKAARDRLEQRRRDVETAEQLATQLARLGEEVATGLASLERAARAAAVAVANAEEAGARWHSAAAALKEAEGAAHAAAAAHGHRPGDPCPVCQRELPLGWEPPAAGDLAEARRAEEESKEAYDLAARARDDAEVARRTSLAKFVASASAVVAKLDELGQLTASRDLPQPPRLAAGPVADDVALEGARVFAKDVGDLERALARWRASLRELLPPLESVEREALEVAEKARAELDIAQAAAKEAGQAVAGLDKERALAEQAKQRAESAVRALDARAAQREGEIPRRWASLVARGAEDPVADARALVLADKEVVARSLEAVELAEGAARVAGERVGALETERRDKVQAPFLAAKAAMADVIEVVRTLSRRLELPHREDLREPSSVGAALEAARATKELADECRGLAAERVAALGRERETLAAPAKEIVRELFELSKQLDAGGALTAWPDLEDPLSPRVSQAVTELVGAAAVAALAAKDEAEKAGEQLETAKALDRRLSELAKWRGTLAGALEVLKKDNFPAWARERRVTELVDAASELLSAMTGGKYRFDSRLQISDEKAGIVRSAKTLSGGEKFEAALALALGVAEIAGRSGVRFETLFLDEGFAGLDRQNLDRALDALDNEVAQGRRVVLITHIGAVADRIKDVLYIEPDGTGASKARWLTEEERYELGADLDLEEGGSGTGSF